KCEILGPLLEEGGNISLNKKDPTSVEHYFALKSNGLGKKDFRNDTGFGTIDPTSEHKYSSDLKALVGHHPKFNDQITYLRQKETRPGSQIILVGEVTTPRAKKYDWMPPSLIDTSVDSEGNPERYVDY